MGKLGCQILVQSKYFDTYRPVILVVGTYNIGMRFFSNYIYNGRACHFITGFLYRLFVGITRPMLSPCK